jgi:hypothetical protein
MSILSEKRWRSGTLAPRGSSSGARTAIKRWSGVDWAHPPAVSRQRRPAARSRRSDRQAPVEARLSSAAGPSRRPSRQRQRRRRPPRVPPFFELPSARLPAMAELSPTGGSGPARADASELAPPELDTSLASDIAAQPARSVVVERRESAAAPIITQHSPLPATPLDQALLQHAHAAADSEGFQGNTASAPVTPLPAAEREPQPAPADSGVEKAAVPAAAAAAQPAESGPARDTAANLSASAAPPPPTTQREVPLGGPAASLLMEAPAGSASSAVAAATQPGQQQPQQLTARSPVSIDFNGGVGGTDAFVLPHTPAPPAEDAAQPRTPQTLLPAEPQVPIMPLPGTTATGATATTSATAVTVTNATATSAAAVGVAPIERQPSTGADDVEAQSDDVPGADGEGTRAALRTDLASRARSPMPSLRSQGR